MVIEVKLLRPFKAYFSIEMTPSDIVIELRLSQSSNKLPLIEVTLPGIVMDVKLLQL